jgi:hypothetical protein
MKSSSLCQNSGLLSVIISRFLVLFESALSYVIDIFEDKLWKQWQKKRRKQSFRLYPAEIHLFAFKVRTVFSESLWF